MHKLLNVALVVVMFGCGRPLPEFTNLDLNA